MLSRGSSPAGWREGVGEGKEEVLSPGCVSSPGSLGEFLILCFVSFLFLFCVFLFLFFLVLFVFRG